MDSSASKIDRLPSEVLLEAFKKLDCQQMVKTRRVWKEWSDLINLTSLIIGWMLTSREGRDILEPSSHSLKHLDIEFIKSVDGDREIRPLAFPNLQIWESNYFPAWIVPSPETIISVLGFHFPVEL